MTKNKKVLLAASHSIIEPLGLFHLSEIARQEGWIPKIVLAHEPDFKELESEIQEFKPNAVGFTLYTGNHMIAIKSLKNLKQKHNFDLLFGGPHPTYFPKESAIHADYVFVSESFDSFRSFLKGNVQPGIVPFVKKENFPTTDRTQFYIDYPGHDKNTMKNVTTSTGCVFRCSYCYNSSRLEDIASDLEDSQVNEMQAVLAPSGRLFPTTQRPVEDVIKEIENLQRISPATQKIFFQDDIFGRDLNWLEKFTKAYNKRMPFHINMRFELIGPHKDKSKRRTNLLKKAGCEGMSLAIETADPYISKEVLNRNFNPEMVFKTMEYLSQLEMTVRTYQMIGLPYGATPKQTKINLEADLETLKFNVDLRRETGLPTFAWASTLMPYPGTKIAEYCEKHGFYCGDYREVTEDSYRIHSIINFAKEWVGPSLSKDDKFWLPKNEQDLYKEQLNLLMNYFPTFARTPGGDEFAKKFLTQKDHSTAGFNQAHRYHVYDKELFKLK